ncbi:MAG: alpha-ketoglutarate-dependent dioxygenase AlkB [Bacteroidetes bacterium]|nr:alpha-ketoglutarate-dependent dioxygenase AlkB [Bacteroidota bacterium]
MLDLFNDHLKKNILPRDGEVIYYGCIFTHEESNIYYKQLLEYIDWKNDEAYIYGKLIVTKRKAAWYGDQAFDYTYSKRTKTALPWTTELLSLKQLIEQKTNETYNSCLLNLYHDGNEGMAWHSDDEPALKKYGSIASLSFGAERKFSFKHKLSKETVSIVLEHGSMLEMKNETQQFWLHKLPTTTKVTSPRINLTFRNIVV